MARHLSKLSHHDNVSTFSFDRIKGHRLPNTFDYQRHQELSPQQHNVDHEFMSRPSGIEVIDADCCAVGSEFESRRRHGCL
ncbi:hypothetical protein TNCV_3733231 [Trichonephila clavipes]|nr:hypothetical protein TNCV_3733231 [Trichonephila clavipes]